MAGNDVKFVLPETSIQIIEKVCQSWADRLIGWDKMFIKPGQQVEDVLKDGEYGYIINTLEGEPANLPRVDALIVNLCNEQWKLTNSTWNPGMLNGRTVDIKLRKANNTSDFGVSGGTGTQNFGIRDVGSEKRLWVGRDNYNINFLLNTPVVTNNYGYTIFMELSYEESLINQGSDLLYVSEFPDFNNDSSSGSSSYRTRDLRVELTNISGNQGSYTVMNTGTSNITSNVRFSNGSKIKVALAVQGDTIDFHVNGTKSTVSGATKALRPRMIGLSRGANSGKHVNMYIHRFIVWNTYLDEIDIALI